MKKMKNVNRVVISTMALGMVVAMGPAAFAEPGVLPANRDTDVQVKFIEDDSPQLPVDPNDPDPENPVVPIDPTNPEVPVEPGTNGPLSLDFASILDFGEQTISTRDQVYYAAPQLFRDAAGNIDTANPKPNYVQVTDKRGGEKGWSLSVKQNGQFKAATSGRELTGAEITLNNGQVATKSTSLAPSIVQPTISLTADGTGVSENVVSASAGEGFGTWVYRFGDATTMNESIQLSVPGATAKDADVYKTSLTWTLKDVPVNG